MPEFGKVFEIKGEWAGKCAATQNKIEVDCGEHSCKVFGKFGKRSQESIETGKFYIDALYASTLYITPIANSGFKSTSGQRKIEVGPESHNIVFDFTEGSLPVADDGLTGEDQAGEISFNEKILYQVQANAEMLKSLLSLAVKE